MFEFNDFTVVLVWASTIITIFVLMKIPEPKHSLHFYLHDIFGYIGFLINIPFHYFHRVPEGLIGKIFTLKGCLVCGCGYCYDRGHYQMNCKRCYDEEEKRFLRTKI